MQLTYCRYLSVDAANGGDQKQQQQQKAAVHLRSCAIASD